MTPIVPSAYALHLSYDNNVTLRLQTPPAIEAGVSSILKPFIGKPVDDIVGLMQAVSKCAARGGDAAIAAEDK